MVKKEIKPVMVRIDPVLWARVKKHAAEKGVLLSAFVATTLAAALPSKASKQTQ